MNINGENMVAITIHGKSTQNNDLFEKISSKIASKIIADVINGVKGRNNNRKNSKVTLLQQRTKSCTVSHCMRRETSFMLQCCRCVGYTHYACTKLPPYQVALFLNSVYQSLYTCEMCAGDIPLDVIVNCNNKPMTKSRRASSSNPEKLVEEKYCSVDKTSRKASKVRFNSYNSLRENDNMENDYLENDNLDLFAGSITKKVLQLFYIQIQNTEEQKVN